MKILVCKRCGHIEFGKAPEKCKVCGAPSSAFIEKPDAIKSPANPAALTEGDRKHIPKIVTSKSCALLPNTGCVDVHVKVGEIEHVMEDKHYIMYLDLYFNHEFISRVLLSPRTCHPAACWHLNVSAGTVTVIEYCNVHGNWISEVQI